jgi:hypothetical protein
MLPSNMLLLNLIPLIDVSFEHPQAFTLTTPVPGVVGREATFRQLLRISRRTGCDQASELQFFQPCEV